MRHTPAQAAIHTYAQEGIADIVAGSDEEIEARAKQQYLGNQSGRQHCNVFDTGAVFFNTNRRARAAHERAHLILKVPERFNRSAEFGQMHLQPVPDARQLSGPE